MRDGASFSRGSKGGMVIIYRGVVYTKMFCGGMMLFSGGMASPLNSSTAYNYVIEQNSLNKADKSDVP